MRVHAKNTATDEVLVFDADKALVAVGVQPNTEDLDVYKRQE